MDEVLHRLIPNAFEGWQPLVDFVSSSCPATGGVYAVVYLGGTPIQFRETSTGGWHKGRNPTVDRSLLNDRWIDGTRLAYVGKANNLKGRLRAFRDFGRGKPVGHWGGRLIWQLPDIAAIQVGWLQTPNEDPRAVELYLLDAFVREFCRLPFANLTR